MKRINAGFTLLELGLVLVVLSLLISGLLAAATQNVRISKQEELKNKMDAIEAALVSFRKANNRLPCPGDITVADTSVYLGVESATAGTCTGGTPAVPGALVSGNAVGGGVPVRALGLPDVYAIDPWGNYFFYVVDKRITGSSAFTTYSAGNSSIGALTIKDEAGATRTSRGVALLLSFGTNGHGAYQANGTRKYVGSTNAHEWDNCGCNATAATSFDAVFFMHPGTAAVAGALAGFDDTARYYMREYFLSNTADTLTETP